MPTTMIIKVGATSYWIDRAAWQPAVQKRRCTHAPVIRKYRVDWVLIRTTECSKEYLQLKTNLLQKREPYRPRRKQWLSDYNSSREKYRQQQEVQKSNWRYWTCQISLETTKIGVRLTTYLLNSFTETTTFWLQWKFHILSGTYRKVQRGLSATFQQPAKIMKWI